MKKLVIILLVSTGFYCLKSKDSIEESIATLQPEKLREILAHNPGMSAASQEKYLSQISQAINEIEQWEKTSNFYNKAPKNLLLIRKKAFFQALLGLYSGIVGGFILLETVAELIESRIIKPWPKKFNYFLINHSFFPLSVGVLLTFFGIENCRKASVRHVALNGLNQVYMIKALLERAETAAAAS